MPFNEELELFQQQNIIMSLGVIETAEWYNNFVLVPKPIGKVRLCLDPLRLNQTLVWPVNRGPTLNDICTKLNNVKYIAYRCKIQLSQTKARWQIIITHKIYMPIQQIQEITADDILVIGYDSDDKDHDDMLQKALKICRQVNLNLMKEKCHFRCTSVLCFEKWYLGTEWDLTH